MQLEWQVLVQSRHHKSHFCLEWLYHLYNIWHCLFFDPASPPPPKKKIPLNGGKRRKKTLMRTRGAVCIDFQYVKWDLVQRRVVRIYMVLSTFYILDKRKHSSHIIITILKKKYKIRQWIINILLLPPQNPPVCDVWCVCVCVCVCSVAHMCMYRHWRMAWIMDGGVNRKRKAPELSECERVHVCPAGSVQADIQRRQMGNYQAAAWRVFATVRNTNASVLSADSAAEELAR